MSGTINGVEMLGQMQTVILQGVTTMGAVVCLATAVLLTMAVLAAGILRPLR